ncbi:MAG: SCO family protein [Rhodomicrobium sp.]
MIRAFALLGFMFAFCAPCGAELSPNQLKEVALNPSPGAAVPLDAEFKSSPGEQLSLGDALGGKPAVLILVDFKCRFTCGTALAVAAAGLSGTGLEAGRDYNFLVMGIDPKDSLADAGAMKANYLAPFPALLAQAKFLNGSAGSIAAVTSALGYTPVYDPERGEFAHPLGVVILTGAGRVSRVIGGLGLDAALLRTAVLDARESRLSALVEGIRLLCYGHAPLSGRYKSAVQALIEAVGVLTLLGIGGTVAFLARRKGAQS